MGSTDIVDGWVDSIDIVDSGWVSNIDIVDGWVGGVDIVDIIVDGVGLPKGGYMDSVGPI